MNTKMSFAPVPYRLGLYPVVNSLTWLIRMLDAGVTTVQLRIKDHSKTQVATNIEAAVLLGRHHNARVFINDYWQLAIHYGAYGIHLGQEDMESTDADAIRAAGLRLGLSAYNEIDLVHAVAWQPSYIALGHIFPTTTKIMKSSPQGLDTLRRLVSKMPPIPTVAIGGIRYEQVEAVLACGVGSVAVTSAITSSPDWRWATSVLQLTIAAWEHKHNHKDLYDLTAAGY